MEFETIRLDVADRVAAITLNRPDRLNAFNVQMMRDLISALDHTDGNDEVGAVVVTGEGRGFCAGADLASGGETFDHSDPNEPNKLLRDGGGILTLRIFRSAKPIIAAINGPAVGVGITMTLPMDIRIFAESAKVGFVFPKRGLVPEAASSWFLPRLVGISQAAEWCYTGRVMPAADAVAGGLGSLVDDAQLLEKAQELAAEIVVNAPVSVALTRQMLWRGLTMAHPMEAHRADSRAIQALGSSLDAKEGVQSFLEKRPPEWKLAPSSTTPDVFADWVEPEFH